jgi:hypothetical protein
MEKAGTSKLRTGTKKAPRLKRTIPALDHAVTLIETVCSVAAAKRLIGGPTDEQAQQLRAAIANHDTALLFERLVEAFSMQGISDYVAFAYMDRHGRLTWRGIVRAMEHPGGCPKLRGYWTLHGCGYEKGSGICSEPKHVGFCPLPHHDLRNGRLNQTAYSLYLFVTSQTATWSDGSTVRSERQLPATRPTAHGECAKR